MMWYKLPSLKNCDPKSLLFIRRMADEADGEPPTSSPVLFLFFFSNGELRLVVNLKLLRGQYPR